MKRMILPVIIVASLQATRAQDFTGNTLLSAKNKRYLIYLDMHDSQATAFQLGYWFDKAGSGHTIIYTDTLIKQPGNKSILFEGKKFRVIQSDKNRYVVLNNGAKAGIDTVADLPAAYTNINEGYWYSLFFRMCDSINAAFPMQHYSFRNAIGLWNSFDNKSASFSAFKAFADRKVLAIKDSLYLVHIPYSQLTDQLVNNITTAGYAALRDGISRLPAPGCTYVSSIIDALCMTRPALFFQLAEDMPDKKEMLFDAVVYGKALARKQLRKTETGSITKKELMKRLKEERKMRNGSILAATAGAVLMVTCVLVLTK